MTDIDPDAAGPGATGAPARPPGQVPDGYVPAAQVDAVPLRAPSRWPRSGLPLGGGQGGGSFLDQPGIPPVNKSQAWRWLLYALGGFLVGEVVASIFGVVSGDIAGKSAAQMAVISAESVPPEWYVVTTLIGLWFGFLGAPWLASRTQGTRHFLADIGLRFRWIDLVGIVIGFAAQLVIAVLYAPFQHDITNYNAPTQKLTGSSHGVGFLVIALATVLLAPLMEELFFRGLLFKALVRLFTPSQGAVTTARRAGVVLAVIADGLLFGLAHGEWVQLAGLALFGMVLAGISYRTGRLGMNFVSHASFNLVAVISILSQRGGVIH
jgi:uncharacterized protein